MRQTLHWGGFSLSIRKARELYQLQPHFNTIINIILDKRPRYVKSNKRQGLETATKDSRNGVKQHKDGLHATTQQRRD